MVSDISHLKEVAKNYSILYAEDNKALRDQASKLLEKLFDVVYVAEDGEVALNLFKKHHPPILISDIKMPHRDGISLAKQVKALHPETIVIVMSAFDDKEYLLKGIELGIFRFLKKPVNVSQLSEVLLAAIKAIKREENSEIFYANLSDVFNYQSALVVMMEKSKMILASQRFLDFFNVESIDDFIQKRGDIGSCLLKHDGFLYNEADKNWFEVAHRHQDKLFHIKMMDAKHVMSHFIFKLHSVPEKPDFSILSFDDITELDLLDLFDGKKAKEDKALSN